MALSMQQLLHAQDDSTGSIPVQQLLSLPTTPVAGSTHSRPVSLRTLRYRRRWRNHGADLAGVHPTAALVAVQPACAGVAADAGRRRGGAPAGGLGAATDPGARAVSSRRVAGGAAAGRQRD